MANRETRRANDFDIRKYIKGSNAIEGITDEREVDQSLVAWAHLESLSGILSHGDICKVQKIITINQKELQPNQRGYYRGMAGNDVNVRVGKKVAPKYQEVEGLMRAWLQDVPKMTPLIGHVRFEHIHPFVDGNGRTGRMLYWFVCKQRGIKPKYFGTDRYPELDEQKNRDTYYRLFDPKKIETLEKNAWGTEKPKYDVRAKGTDGQFYGGHFFNKPKDSEIEEGMPKGVKIVGQVMIRELK